MTLNGKITTRSVLAGGAFVVALILGAPTPSGAGQMPQQNPSQTPSQYPNQNPSQDPNRTPNQFPDQTGSPQGARSTQNPQTDKNFIKQVAQINVDEQKLGELAQQKGNSDAVKDFGKRMVDDHSNAQSQLKDLAQRQGVTLPAEPDSRASKFEQQLSSKSGTQFDQAYLKHMIAGHKKAISLLKREIQSGSDPNVKSYAQNTLPTIQEHLRMAQEAVGKAASATGAGLH